MGKSYIHRFATKLNQNKKTPLFYSRVYDIVLKIPKGKMLSYVEVARRAGSSQACRAVGNAMRRNMDWPRVPCHRVVQNNGHIGNWSGKGGAKRKEALL